MFITIGRFEKLAGASRVAVRAELVAPTAIDVAIQAGDAIPYVYESLPLAMTVAIPAARKVSTDGLSRSLSHEVIPVYNPPPKLILTAANVPHSAVRRCAKTQLSAKI